MKKAILFIAILGLIASCGNQPKQNNTAENQPKPFSVETYNIQGDKLIATHDEYEEHFSFACEIDIPTTDNQALYDSICYWIAGQFGSDYDGDPRNVKTMVNHYKNRALEFEEGDYMEGYALEYTIKMLEANDRYVTYSYSIFFESSGAPRANYETTYITFNSKTGQHFTYQMVRRDENLKQLVMNALFEQFFSDWEDEDLADLLFFDPEDDEDYGFFLPQYDDPWIYNNYIYFGYSEHEIADRCTGQPQCGLPYDVVEPYLTEEGKAFFKE